MGKEQEKSCVFRILRYPFQLLQNRSTQLQFLDKFGSLFGESFGLLLRGYPRSDRLVLLCLQIQILKLPNFIGEDQSKLSTSDPRGFRSILDVFRCEIDQNLFI